MLQKERQKEITSSKKSMQRHPAEPLNQLTIEIIDFFVRLSPLLGQPRSVAVIYGLLFSSVRPLDLNEVIERLRLSRGSASQGLNALLRLGAARRTYLAGRRTIHYEAVADLGCVIVRLLRERIPPELGGSPTWLKEAARMAKRMSPYDSSTALRSCARDSISCSILAISSGNSPSFCFGSAGF